MVAGEAVCSDPSSLIEDLLEYNKHALDSPIFSEIGSGSCYVTPLLPTTTHM